MANLKTKIALGCVAIFAAVAGSSVPAVAQPLLAWAAPAQNQSSIFDRFLREPAAPPRSGDAAELPAHLRRQVVDFRTGEAAGTIIVDTPNTYLYYVLGGGKAIRYGIGVGREGFTWSGVQTVARKAEWPDWIPPAEMLGASLICRVSWPAVPAIRSAPAPCISAAPSIASTAPISLRPSAGRFRAVASAW